MRLELRLTFLPLFALLLQVVLARWNGRTCPTPGCDFCLSAAVHDAPGVGFDLINSTAVAHLYNKTVLDIAKIPATPEYQALAERLGNTPIPNPPGRLASWRRWLNKKRGLAATADVEVLASLLISLKSATVAALADPIDRVAVTRTSIPGLTKGDLDDALEYAGLRGWMDVSNGSEPKHVSESQAVFAGNGQGLCPSYRDVMECRLEGLELPRHLGLFISLTRHALYMSLDDVQYAFPQWRPDGPQVLDFGLGLDHRGGFAPNDYWASLYSRIALFVRQYSEQPVHTLLLGGENATNSVFLQTVRKALGSVTPMWSSVLDIDIATVADPTFAAARGMAVYARRRQEAPGPCKENFLLCDERREKERNRESEPQEEWDMERGQERIKGDEPRVELR